MHLVVLNRVMREISAATSNWTARRLIHHYGGRRLAFPLNPRPDHPIAILTGRPHFTILCELHGGLNPVRIPRQSTHVAARRRIRMMRSLYFYGIPSAAIAEHFKVTQRFVVKAAGPKYAWLGSDYHEAEQFWHGKARIRCLDSRQNLQPDRTMYPAIAQPLSDEPPLSLAGVSIVQVFRVLRALLVIIPKLNALVQTKNLNLEQTALFAGFAVVPILEELGLVPQDSIPQGDSAQLYQAASEALACEGVPIL